MTQVRCKPACRERANESRQVCYTVDNHKYERITEQMISTHPPHRQYCRLSDAVTWELRPCITTVGWMWRHSDTHTRTHTPRHTLGHTHARAHTTRISTHWNTVAMEANIASAPPLLPFAFLSTMIQISFTMAWKSMSFQSCISAQKSYMGSEQWYAIAPRCGENSGPR